MSALSDDILCERCGYAIGGLDEGGACPECGLTLSASSPAARRGSAWQQRPSVGSWSRTLAGLTHPLRLFDTIRVADGPARSLLYLNLAVASLPLAATPTYALWRLSIGRRVDFGLADTVLTWSLGAAISWLGLFWLLWLLTRIEWVGIRVIGARRGWRVTSTVATVVCAHASFGWVVSGVLSLAGLGAGVMIGPPSTVARGAWAVGSSGLGFLAGLLLFETLIYVGLRRCRFANPPNGAAASPE